MLDTFLYIFLPLSLMNKLKATNKLLHFKHLIQVLTILEEVYFHSCKLNLFKDGSYILSENYVTYILKRKLFMVVIEKNLLEYRLLLIA